MNPSTEAASTFCMECTPLHTPGMRSTTVEVEGKGVVRYLREFWVCSVCAREWEDDELSRRNEAARENARLRSRDRRRRVV
jgi:transposase-like protein